MLFTTLPGFWGVRELTHLGFSAFPEVANPRVFGDSCLGWALREAQCCI